MKLVILYGPPAVGKLTVAKKVAEKTGYVLFHNHLAADLAASLHPFGTPAYADFVADIRTMYLNHAFRSRIPGIIMTLVYGIETHEGKNDDKFIRRIIRKAKTHRVPVFFVRLTCDESTLMRRVGRPSRGALKKLRRPKILQRILRTKSVRCEIPAVRSLTIDTKTASPGSAAEKIILYTKRPSR